MTIQKQIYEWHHSTQSCKKCKIADYCKHKVTHSLKLVSDKIDLMIIGEAPGDVEYAEQEVFIGPAGQVLRDILAEAVEPDISWVMTNAILCPPYIDDTLYKYGQPSLSEIRACSPWIRRLYEIANPLKVIAVGKIGEKAAKIIDHPRFLAITHPAKIMRSNHFNYEFDKAVLAIQEYMKRPRY